MTTRPDLGRLTLLTLLFTLCVVVPLLGAYAGEARPGTPLRQTAALLGSLLLVVPFAFSVAKRAGASASPPRWFVAHALSAMLGAVLVTWHASGGAWWSPPGLVLAALFFLVVQGALARALLARPLAAVFASRLPGFVRIDGERREQLAAVIADKRRLLQSLDATADEGLFSPTLGHWLRAPQASLRYTRLAARERRLVGARHSAGVLLAEWRALHILVALLFWVGLLAHVVVMTFFAGYAAGDEAPYWWHLTAWGG